MKHHNRGDRRGRKGFVATLAILGVLLTAGLASQSPAEPAYAANYPSWQDVLNARSSESAKSAEIKRLQGLIAQLESTVVAAEAEAMAKGDEFIAAQQAYDEAAFKLGTLREQVAVATAAAEESLLKAGQLAARLQRSGTNDLTATLLFTESDDLLSQLGRATKVNEQSSGVFNKAKQDENAAQALSETAAVQEAALAELATIAEQAMIEAQKASDAATAALAEQAANQTRLQAQLVSLQENRLATEAEFQVGDRIRVEAARAAAAAAAAAAAEAAKNNGGSGNAGGGAPSSSGWVRPSGGGISSHYGWRVPPTSGASTLHGGVDLAPGCNSPIYAASSGTVVFAGLSGGYGNYIKINHPDGSQTAYAHIVNGGILVHNGQQVSAGQQIARVGTTGTSTGCHLHFEVRVGGATQDPVPFLRARGVAI
ncbi:M23 family metallopeptidase [Salinibacterium hongtaonis]|uniref:M23 family peptidase n=1 Tax=Homoserinimonas hongtaonis TaxID=2079791 RepID=A0A2U1T118_9MICO|nr:M23 family metallopeptidase [Salinibacterium hongtaonis]AWB90087.1 hypothetical protein C2138_11510 [Salinibacterium hongtaonis]PWB97542.1 M23 family peptidase [Salinibacterium hongtaonis]